MIKSIKITVFALLVFIFLIFSISFLLSRKDKSVVSEFYFLAGSVDRIEEIKQVYGSPFKIDKGESLIGTEEEKLFRTSDEEKSRLKFYYWSPPTLSTYVVFAYEDKRGRVLGFGHIILD